MLNKNLVGKLILSALILSFGLVVAFGQVDPNQKARKVGKEDAVKKVYRDWVSKDVSPEFH